MLSSAASDLKITISALALVIRVPSSATVASAAAQAAVRTANADVVVSKRVLAAVCAAVAPAVLVESTTYAFSRVPFRVLHVSALLPAVPTVNHVLSWDQYCWRYQASSQAFSRAAWASAAVTKSMLSFKAEVSISKLFRAVLMAEALVFQSATLLTLKH